MRPRLAERNCPMPSFVGHARDAYAGASLRERSRNMVYTSRLMVVLAISSFVLGGCGAAGCGDRQARAEGRSTPATAPGAPAANRPADAAVVPAEDPPDSPEGITQPAGPPPAGLAIATFAGGCFWCLEYAFEHVNGVRDAISGYTGGPEQHPSYEAVSNHRTG